jgi:23S rRNA pseudouridine1911/1915/1917 synthase
MTTKPLWTLAVPAAHSGERLDVFLTATLQHRGEVISRAKVQRLIDAGSVLHNGKVCKGRALLQEGDVLEVMKRPPVALTLTPVCLDLDILFEDRHIIVVNKPAGLTVHPGAGTREPTLVEGLLYHCGKLSNIAGDSLVESRPGIVHRLDKDTSGVIVCAKTDQAHAQLARQFQDKTNRREYLALLDGVLPKAEVEHESYLHRDPAVRVRFKSASKAQVELLKSSSGVVPPGYRLARSHFQSEKIFAGRLSLVRVTLRTGRTHQIRVHAQDLGVAVWGDPVYGAQNHPGRGRARQLPSLFTEAVRAELEGVNRQLLHAAVLGFKHPLDDREMIFSAPYPADFRRVLDLLEPYCQK